jgi:hypothetical protein
MKCTKEEIEKSLKLTDIQKRWLDNSLKAYRDRHSETIYELTPRVRKVRGIWKQVYV